MLHADYDYILANVMAASTLIDIEGLLLMYANLSDSYWGIGHDMDKAARMDPSEWKIANILAKLLMQVHCELIHPVCPTHLLGQLFGQGTAPSQLVANTEQRSTLLSPELLKRKIARPCSLVSIMERPILASLKFVLQPKRQDTMLPKVTVMQWPYMLLNDDDVHISGSAGNVEVPYAMDGTSPKKSTGGQSNSATCAGELSESTGSLSKIGKKSE